MNVAASQSLRTRLMGVLAVAAIVPTVVVGWLAVHRARLDVGREVVAGRLALVRALGASLDGTLQDAQRALALVGGAWAENATPAAEGSAVGAGPARRLLGRVKRELPIVRRVALLDPEGRHLAGDDLPLGSFLGAGTFGGYVGRTEFAEGEPRVVIWAQARGRTGELHGYVAAEIDLGFVAASLRAARLPGGARLFVVDDEGRLIASSRAGDRPGGASLRDDHPAVAPALAAADDGSVEALGRLSVYRNLGSFQTTRGVAWAVVLDQDVDAAYALANAARRDTLVVGGIVLLAALAMGYFTARALLRPLGKLTERVDAIAVDGPSLGAAPARELEDAPGEIGLLARRFDEMARRLEEREKLRAALARGERLASVGALAAGVAHEINNPLTTVLGYANLLLEDKPEGHPDRAPLELVAEEARRVQGIVRGLLDYSRAEPAGFSTKSAFDVRALLERTAKLLSPTLKSKGIALEMALADDLPRPLGDERRLQQVFVNLLQNATQAMERGGKLTIRAARAPGGVAVEVVDQGPGIPAELLGRIFEPFFTTKGPGTGTGLGLAVSQQIVLDHGGRIEVESVVGQGSTFRVILTGGEAQG